MPELPEVEVSRQGISPFLCGEYVSKIIIRESKMRWPIPDTIYQLQGQQVQQINRRGKYLLIETQRGTAIIHLGMSGSLRILPIGSPVTKHDHVDIQLSNGKLLRLNDPRRFGALLWTTEPWQQHKLLATLGPEPFDAPFDAEYLFQGSHNKRQAIKNYIMDSHIVVGVGNIYANEALYLSQIHPKTPAQQLTHKQYQRLVQAIKQILQSAIQQGGTTLKDFTRSDGRPGYFAQQLNVYGLQGNACHRCGTPIIKQIIHQRASYFCPQCQPEPSHF